MQQHYHGEYKQSNIAGKKAKGWIICSAVSGICMILLLIGVQVTVTFYTLNIIFNQDEKNNTLT